MSASEDPIALFLEDIKDKDNYVVVDTMNKFTIVAAAIGTPRVIKELLPLLPHLVTMTNDEVLCSLARQLYYVYDIVGGGAMPKESLTLILDALKALASEEEVAVRHSAVIALSKITPSLSPAEVSQKILPIFQTLSSGDWFAPRVSAASLAPYVLSNLPESDQATARALFVQLCNDETPMTRRAAALVLGNVASIIAVNCNYNVAATTVVYKNEIFPIVKNFSIDERDHIRELAPKTIDSIIPYISPADYMQIVLPQIQGLRDDHSWRVRASLVSQLPIIASNTLKLVIKQIEAGGDAAKSVFKPSEFDLIQVLGTLVDLFNQLIADANHEVRAAAAIAFSSMVRVMYGYSINTNTPAKPRSTVDITATDNLDIEGLYLSEPESKADTIKVNKIAALATFIDPVAPKFFDHVGLAVSNVILDSSSLFKIDLCEQLALAAPIVGKDLTQKFIIPAFERLSHDENADVRSAVVDNIELLVETVGPQTAATTILNILTKLVKDARWRVRRSVAGQLGMIARIIGNKTKVFEGKLIELIKLTIGEHVHAVRNRTCAELRMIVSELGHQLIMDKFFPIALELSDLKINYLHRITALYFCLFVATPYKNRCPEKVIVESFLPLISQGLTDSVPNVKVLAAKCIQAMVGSIPHDIIRNKLVPSLQILAQDKDREVALQGTLALQAVPKEAL